ncbi:hypothetical protein J6590_006363 [Homalodisca vitripennis]|nr:hypothetical protein J6590_006363 [Homalodisca vitripennis]
MKPAITDLIRDLTSIQHLIRENEAVSVAETCSLNEVVLSQANKHRTQGRYKHCSTVLGGRLYDDTTNTQLLSGVTLSPIPNLDRSEVNWVIGEDWSFVGKPATPNNQLRSGVTLSPIPNLDRSEVNWVIGEDWSFVGKPATPNNQLRSGVTLSPIPNLDRSEVNWVIGEDWSFVGKPATPNNQLVVRRDKHSKLVSP